MNFGRVSRIIPATHPNSFLIIRVLIGDSLNIGGPIKPKEDKESEDIKHHNCIKYFHLRRRMC